MKHAVHFLGNQWCIQSERVLQVVKQASKHIHTKNLNHWDQELNKTGLANTTYQVKIQFSDPINVSF